MVRKTQLEPLSAARMPPHAIRIHLISRRPRVGSVGLILTLQNNETNILAVSLALLAGIQEKQAATDLFPGPDYVAPGRASS